MARHTAIATLQATQLARARRFPELPRAALRWRPFLPSAFGDACATSSIAARASADTRLEFQGTNPAQWRSWARICGKSTEEAPGDTNGRAKPWAQLPYS